MLLYRLSEVGKTAKDKWKQQGKPKHNESKWKETDRSALISEMNSLAFLCYDLKLLTRRGDQGDYDTLVIY